MNEELKVVITAEIDDLKKGVAEAQEEVSKFAKDGKSGFDQFNDSMTTMGEKSNEFLKGTATAITGVTAALLALGPATAEYREGQAKLATAFETTGSSAETASQVYNDLYRVLGDSDVAVEAAGHLAQLSNDQKALSEWTEICQGVYATFGDSIPIEGLTEAANETAKTGELTGSLADALNWAGESEEAFQKKLEACNTEAEREKLIRETLSGLYDDAAASYEENAASILAQNEAQAAMNEAMAELGEVMEPINTMLMELGAEILADLTPYIKDFAEKHMPDIKEALSGVGEKIGEVMGWIADHWELISTIGAVVLAISVAISAVSTALGIYNTVMAITTAVSAPVAGIIAAIVAAVALLVAGIVLLVKNWDTVKETTLKVWEACKEAVSKAVDAIVKFFTDMWKSITEGVTKAKEAIVNKFNEIKDGMKEKVEAAKEAVSNGYNKIKETMGTVMDAAKKTVSDKLNNIKKAYEDHGGGLKGVVAGYFTAIKETYTAGYDFINNLTGGKLGEMVNKVKEKLNSAKETISNVLENIKKKFSDIWEGVKTIVSNAIEKLKNLMNFKWELPKLKLPHFKITGSFSLNPPSVPKLSVEWYQRGGIFDSPTLFPYGNGRIGGLGENGAEAIVPLEKNTEWLDRIAERLMKKGGSTPIILQVEGKTLAQTTIESINQLTRQTGKLSLNLA